MTRSRLATVLLIMGMAAVVAAGSPLSGSPQPAARAEACRLHADNMWCHNRIPAPVIVDGRVVDHLRSSPWVFDCRAELDRHGLGPHPRRWAHVRSGSDHHLPGWVRDSDISDDTEPLPVC